MYSWVRLCSVVCVCVSVCQVIVQNRTVQYVNWETHREMSPDPRFQILNTLCVGVLNINVLLHSLFLSQCINVYMSV
jgi:hypothetical protein